MRTELYATLGLASLILLGAGLARSADISSAPPAALCEDRDGHTPADVRLTACSALLNAGDLTKDQEAEVRTNRAWAFSLQGKMADARIDYLRSLELTPDSHVAHNEMGLFLLRTGQFDDAIAEYDIALRLRPGAAYSLYGRGLAYERKGDQARGEADLAKARLADSNVDAVFRSIGVR